MIRGNFYVMNRNRDLVIVFIWSITMLLAVFTDTSTFSVVLRGLLGVPLVFLLTGHAVLRAIGFITPSTAEYVVYAVGVSIATSVAGGFLLNQVALLNPIGWAMWFMAVTGGAMFVAGRSDAVVVMVLPNFNMRRWHVGVLGLAGVITVSAYLIAIHDETRDRQFKYTEFWMLPKNGKLVVGIKSAEAETQKFDVEVTSNGTLIAQWQSIVLTTGATWIKDVELTSSTGYKAEAKLYRFPDHAIYRKVSAIKSGEN
jgi:hypothetical protein